MNQINHPWRMLDRLDTGRHPTGPTDGNADVHWWQICSTELCHKFAAICFWLRLLHSGDLEYTGALIAVAATRTEALKIKPDREMNSSAPPQDSTPAASQGNTDISLFSAVGWRPEHGGF
jgi:hypothetical protein